MTITELPPYEDGWLLASGERAAFLSCVPDDSPVHWSESLEELHEESSRTHFLDRWTRSVLLAAVREVPGESTIVDLGCSTGYLLEDLETAWPGAELIGVDLVAGGLAKAHESVPRARLLQADVCALPLADQSADAVVSANLLEHVPDDHRALEEVQRVLRPGGVAAFVVPAGPRTFDYYDRFLGHQRRYARGELRGKCQDAGLEVTAEGTIGALLYPAFWAVKQRNRLLRRNLEGDALQRRVSRDIANTHDSRIGAATWHIEARLAERGVRLPWGIRHVVVARRRGGDGR